MAGVRYSAASRPPSTEMTWPFTNDEASDARKTAAPTDIEGSHQRPAASASLSPRRDPATADASSGPARAPRTRRGRGLPYDGGDGLPIARRATRIPPARGAFVVGAIAYGGLYTFPALSVAFADEFGISRTLAVTPWTMFLVVTAVASPLLGRAYDEFADRDLLTASMVLLAAGWLAVYLAPDISLVILAYAVFMALGLQLSFIGTSTAIARRYAGMSGLALGIAYAGPGIGVAVALPVAGGLIATAGWRSTSLVFLASCLVGVVFVWMMTSGPAIVVPARRWSGGGRGARPTGGGRGCGTGPRAAARRADQRPSSPSASR